MQGPPIRSSPDQVIGRYALFREIAAGGMASVHLGRLMGPAGFSRVVAIKRLHPHLARDPEFVTMFVDEARLAARVQHPNVVPTLDIVAENGELFIVMEYVEGESLARLARLASESGRHIPVPVVAAVMIGALQGLHAAHEARSEEGRPLGLVHRDISPQNVLVGVDGLSRVVDFGVAKAAGRGSQTAGGMLKGKLPYMAPEQIRLEPIDRRTDLYALSIVLWEMLAGKRLFTGGNDWDIASRIKAGLFEPPSAHNPEVSPALDALVRRGASTDPERRFATALDMADALEHAAPIAPSRAVGRFVESLANESLARRRQLVVEAESVRSDIGVLGGGSVVTMVEAAAPSRPMPPSSEKTSSTRLGGVFAQATPSASAHSRPSLPSQPIASDRTPPPPSAPVHSRPTVSGMFVPEEGPGTAAGWSTVVQRRLSAPLVGVIAGVIVAVTIAVIALVVRIATAEDAPATTASPTLAETQLAPAVAPSEMPAPTAEPVPEITQPQAPPETAPAPIHKQPASPPSAAAVAPPPEKPVKKQPECELETYFDEDGEKRFRKRCPPSK